ncbi:hypothetical protein DEJ02_14770 [Curtobacterium sp. MCLR17_042]|nr:hypothetical protein DEJ02_14770 [Curtobacterium sp. MCLR17_042]
MVLVDRLVQHAVLVLERARQDLFGQLNVREAPQLQQSWHDHARRDFRNVQVALRFTSAE